MVSLIGAYEFICPSQAHWNLRAKSLCKATTNYTCLFDINFQINVYRDRCNRPRIVGPGYKYVFQPNLNRAACSGNRYQPSILRQLGTVNVPFKNHLATAKVRRRMKTATLGQTQRAFVILIEDILLSGIRKQCYCNPSTEDCSCYLGISPYNETVGLRDTKCYKEMVMTRGSYLEDLFNISRTIQITEFDNYKYNLNHHPTSKCILDTEKLQ
ncbi:unnamed protein product [Mytilus edulis]|uniref:Uncharacterized protein n=1 Tax=Mytilus edulis TaxID=6550 RepID=A0A8S3QV92_MYTED|nr:unnamed protein product [Mytilus edulis]